MNKTTIKLVSLLIYSEKVHTLIKCFSLPKSNSLKSWRPLMPWPQLKHKNRERSVMERQVSLAEVQHYRLGKKKCFAHTDKSAEECAHQMSNKHENISSL